MLILRILIGGFLPFLSYALFHPYADTLKQKVIFNVIGLPGLFAMLLPMLRTEGPGMIAVYFGYFAIQFAVATVIFHFIEQAYRHR